MKKYELFIPTDLDAHLEEITLRRKINRRDIWIKALQLYVILDKMDLAGEYIYVKNKEGQLSYVDVFGDGK